MRFCGGFDVLSVPPFLFDLLSSLAYIRRAIWSFPSWLGLSAPESYTRREFHETSSDNSSAIREMLPLLTFGDFAKKFSVIDGEEIMCSVCLSCFEKEDEIRELCNCCHIFHRNCLDKWIDYHQDTCPLCRCPLLPYMESAVADEANVDDVWVVDRIAYLFGEDLVSS